MIKITDKAKEYLTNTAISKDKPYVRFSVKGGGCAGFKYEWEFADELVEDTIKFDLNEGKSLLIDKVAEMYILGCTIDYVEELGGSYLNVINPNATSSCGCGESFGA
jgi:iron-sulfur cluster assembly accessory protein